MPANNDDFRIVPCDCELPDFASAAEEARLSLCDGCDGCSRIAIVDPVSLDDLEEIDQPCRHSTPT